jgi:hypothetical protein
METPTSSYAISDYIIASLVSLQKNIKNKKEFSKLAKRRAWAHKGYLGGPTNKKSGYSKLGNHYTPRSELDLTSNEIEYSNENINNMLNYVYLSNGIYNFENYNKKKLTEGNKLNKVGLEKINILGDHKLKNEKIIQKYNLNNVTLDTTSLFLWNFQKRKKIDYEKIKKIFRVVNSLDLEDVIDYTKNLKNKNDLYLNEKFDYTPILSNSTFDTKLNKRDLVLDQDLNDFAIYDLYKNNTIKNISKKSTNDSTFESYGEYLEKYKVKNTKKSFFKNYKFINYDNLGGSLRSNIKYNKNYTTPLGVK